MELSERINNITKNVMLQKRSIIEDAILKYMTENNLTEEDIKTHGNKLIYVDSGCEQYLYKDKLIIQIETNNGFLTEA
jgi:hypothetical protein